MRSSAARCLTREQAAEYCGLSVHGFADWVRRGIVPGPIPGTHKWDLKAIDAALDKASGLTEPAVSGYRGWKEGHARRA